MVWSTTREKCENSFQELKQRLVMALMLALPDGKRDFVKYSDASHRGLGCVLMQHGKKELNICQRRQLELIKNNDWEILYHSGKANMVADALSKKERLKMIMSFGEFIRDFEKMEIEVKDDPDYGEEEEMFRLKKQKSSKERRPETGIQEERLKDNLRGFIRKKDQECSSRIMNGDYVTSLEGLDTTCMDSVWLAIKTSWKMNDYSRTKLSKIEAAEKGVVKLWWYVEWKHIRDTKVDEDEVVERKMLGPAVVQRTKDMIDLIR
ncbi:hypothetical protein AgCh_017163 [Apium graveolens]